MILGETSREEVTDLFDFIDLDDSSLIELKEFLVALVILNVLEKLPSKPEAQASEDSSAVKEFLESSEKLKAMADLIAQAYLLFDSEGVGQITRKQVDKLLRDGNSKTGMKTSNALLNEQRWKEMDWNSDGSIDFAEFVFAFSTWVDIEDDMEGGEDDVEDNDGA